MTDKRIDLFSTPEQREFIASVLAGRSDEALRRASTLPGGVNVTGRQGATALLLAVTNSDGGMAKALLEAGADPDGGENACPLHPAVREESGRFVEMLIRAGANPGCTYNFETPLAEAAMVGATANADRLLAAGADIENGELQLGTSPAIVAASAEHWRTVAFLIGRGASPYAADRSGMTVAWFAHSSRMKPDTPDGQARDAIVAKYREVGFPWPPPSPKVVERRMAIGQWPPRLGEP